jgi:hypothetical protein
VSVSRSPTYVCMAAQDSFEAELRRHAETYPEIELRFNTELAAFEQDDIGVTATLVTGAQGRSKQKCPGQIGNPIAAKASAGVRAPAQLILGYVRFFRSPSTTTTFAGSVCST